jgi:serine/threonine protein kinase
LHSCRFLFCFFDSVSSLFICFCLIPAVDLVRNLLRYSPAERFSAKQALAHPYLADYHDPGDEVLRWNQLAHYSPKPQPLSTMPLSLSRWLSTSCKLRFCSRSGRFPKGRSVLLLAASCWLPRLLSVAHDLLQSSILDIKHNLLLKLYLKSSPAQNNHAHKGEEL